MSPLRKYRLVKVFYFGLELNSNKYYTWIAMKLPHFALFTLLALPLLSCQKGEKERLLVGSIPGTNGARALGKIAVSAGGNSFSFAPRPSPKSAPAQTAHGQVTIEAVDISQDGNTWISLLTAPAIVPVRSYEWGTLISISSISISVPPNEYHAVRIRLAPGLTITENVNAVLPASFTDYPAFERVNGVPQLEGPSSTVHLTSANRALIPFRVEPGRDTYLLIGLQLIVYDTPQWRLWATATATSIPPAS